MTQNTPPNVTVIKATRDLQKKVGNGPLDASTLLRAHDALSTGVKTDFVPIALGFLDHLELGIERAANPSLPMAERLQGMTRPVMELKANARMFHYDLVTVLANIMLGFLEFVMNVDDTVLDIVRAHHRTLRAILERQITGSGGPLGHALIHELNDACNRYLVKRNLPPLRVSMV